MNMSDSSWQSAWVVPIRNAYDRIVRSWTQPGRVQNDYEFHRSIEQMVSAYEQLPNNAPVSVKNILLDDLRMSIESMTNRLVDIPQRVTKQLKRQRKLPGI